MSKINPPPEAMKIVMKEVPLCWAWLMEYAEKLGFGEISIIIVDGMPRASKTSMQSARFDSTEEEFRKSLARVP